MATLLHSFPSSVGIETINTCNARCPFCPLFQGESMMDRAKRPAKIMSMELFEKIIREVATWGDEVRSVFQNMNGEPLQDPNFTQRCDIVGAHALGPKIELQTNAQFLNEANARAILAMDCGRVVIGFDGATKEVYERNRVRCNFETVVENIRRFVAIREAEGKTTKIAIQYVRNSSNAHEIVAAWELFREILDPRFDIFQDDFSKDWADKRGDDSFYMMFKPATPTNNPQCQLVHEQLIINSDGAMQACCWDYNLTVSQNSFGNANEMPLIDMWRSANRRKVVASVNAADANDRPEKCRNCILGGPLADATQDVGLIPAQFLVSSSPFGLSYSFN